jgi:hypothetical protein
MKQSSYYHEVFMNNDWHWLLLLIPTRIFKQKRQKSISFVGREPESIYLVLKLLPPPPDQMK